MLDRGKLVWTNETTGLGSSLSIVFPLTNHYALLTSLRQSPEGLKVDWRLTENSDDLAFTALLSTARALKDGNQFAPPNEGQTTLAISYLLPLASMLSGSKRLASAVAEDKPAAPTSDELCAFAT